MADVTVDVVSERVVEVGAVAATDQQVAGLVNTPASSTAAALNSTIATVAANSRPRGNRIVLMGDSLTAYNGGPSTSTPPQSTSGFDSKGMWRWANIMLSQSLNIIGNSGIGGQESSQILARFQTDVLDLNPDIVAILAGTNDDGVEDATEANLEAMYEAALTEGVFVVAFTIPPQTTGALADYRQGVNTWIREYVRTHVGMVLVDLADVWQDDDVAGFVAVTGYMHDTTHPNTRGAQLAGRAIADAINALVPRTLTDVPTDAAPSNMLTNGRFAGSGTSAPTGWTVTGTGNTYAYVPRGDGLPGQRLAITVPVGGSIILTQNINKGVLLREGDDYDFAVTIEPYDLELFGSSTQRINAYVQNYNGSTFSRGADAAYIDGGASYSSARYPLARGVFRTGRADFVAGSTLAQVVIQLTGGGTYLLSDAVARNLTMIEAGVEAPEDVAHTNLITNGEFETDLTDWSAFGGATIARTTAQLHSGVASMSVLYVDAVNSDARFKKVAVAPSTLLNYVLWVKAPAAHAGRVQFNWYVGGGAYLSATNVDFTGTGNWQKLIGTVSAAAVPATAGEMLLALTRSSNAGAPTVYFDDVDVWQ